MRSAFSNPFRALLCAGLWLFLPAPGPGAGPEGLTPTAEVSQTVSVPTLKKLQETVEGQRLLIKGLQAGALEAKAVQEDGEKRLEGLEKGAETTRKDLKRLGEELEEARGGQSAQAKDLAAMKESLEASQKKVAQQIKSMEDFRADFEEKKDRLSGVMDLMSAMKKDLNDNSREIAQLKARVEALNRPDKESPAQDNAFLQAARWPYLPAAALAVAVVALIHGLTK